MAETNITEVVKEIKASDEESLQKVIEDWFERTRTSGMRIGAQYISAGIFGIIQTHILKKEKVSLRDYKRMTDEIIKIISVQLTQQNDSETDTIKENNTNEETVNE